MQNDVHYHVVWYADYEIYLHQIYDDRADALAAVTGVPSRMYSGPEELTYENQANMFMSLADVADEELRYLIMPKEFATNSYIRACDSNCISTPTLN